MQDIFLWSGYLIKVILLINGYILLLRFLIKILIINAIIYINKHIFLNMFKEYFNLPNTIKWYNYIIIIC